ncbi:MAG: lytic murein transglycosylase [Alphaproteobacteria bacterium]
MTMKRLALLITGILLFSPVPAFADDDFDTWLRDFAQEAVDKGISVQTVEQALSGVQPIEQVLRLDRKQPESTITFADYRQNVVTPDRVKKGKELYNRNRQLLDGIAEKYGVPAPYIIALWGIETSYGENTGNFHVIPALVTLAYDGRRSGYFKGELVNALRILDEGHISIADMRGSWAGAMGQNQFMPSSFLSYSADGDGDGKRDIWKSLPDVFSSTARYLNESGWRPDQKWGREISLPNSIPESFTGLDNTRFVSEWKEMGVFLASGQPLPVTERTKAAIVLPDGPSGPAFLIYDNYRVLMRWNKSLYFATSVGLLADRIAQ